MTDLEFRQLFEDGTLSTTVLKCENWPKMELVALRARPGDPFFRARPRLDIVVSDGALTTPIHMSRTQARRLIATLQLALKNLEVDEVMDK